MNEGRQLKPTIIEQPKTPAQIEIIRTAVRLVNDYLKKLGVENLPFDERRIVYTKQSNKPKKVGHRLIEAGYSRNKDLIEIPELAEAHLALLVHEILHAKSAEWRNYPEDSVINLLEERPIKKKGGSVVNKSLGVKTGFVRDSFKNINEGVTEKITREIMEANTTEIDRLQPFFEGKASPVLRTALYDPNIELIDIITEGIAKHNFKKNSSIDIEQEKSNTWKELQKAYFGGHTMYLRKIDEVFGKGTLRRIEEFPYLEIDDTKITLAATLYFDEMRNKINNI